MSARKKDGKDRYNDAFPTRLRELMRKGGIKQQDLADDIGCSRQTISLYQSGEVMPDIDALRIMAKRFNVTSDYLLGLSEAASIDLNERIAEEVTGLTMESIEALKYFKQFKVTSWDDMSTENRLTLNNINRVLGIAYEKIKKVEDGEGIPTLYSLVESYILSNANNVILSIPTDIYEKAERYDVINGNKADALKISEEYTRRQEFAKHYILFDKAYGGGKMCSLFELYQANIKKDIENTLDAYRNMEQNKEDKK